MAKTQFGQDTQAQNAMALRQRADKNKWEELLAMLNYAQKGDPQTMLGFGLGRLLRDGFNTWMRNYKARDEDKHNRAMDEYNKLSEAQRANLSYEDYYNNYWHPRYKTDNAIKAQDAQAQATMNIPNASPTVLPEMSTGQKGRGESATEMNGADNAYVPSPGASADTSAPMRGLLWEEGQAYFPNDANQYDLDSYRFLEGTPFVGRKPRTTWQEYLGGMMP